MRRTNAPSDKGVSAFPAMLFYGDAPTCSPECGRTLPLPLRFTRRRCSTVHCLSSGRRRVSRRSEFSGTGRGEQGTGKGARRPSSVKSRFATFHTDAEHRQLFTAERRAECSRARRTERPNDQRPWWGERFQSPSPRLAALPTVGQMANASPCMPRV
jgi:hypothetical protein